MAEKSTKNQKTIPVTNAKTGETTQRQSLVKQNPSSTPLGEKFPDKSDVLASVTPQGSKTRDGDPRPPNSIIEVRVKTTPKSDKDKKNDPASIEDFIKLFYSGKIKSLPDRLARTLTEKVSGQSISRLELIKDCLNHDNSLEKTKRLLILTLGLKGHPKLERTLRDVVRNIILSHPEMSDQVLDNWFPFSGANQPKNINDLWLEFAVKARSNHLPSSKENSEKDAEGKKISLEDPQKIRRNAYVSAAVWRFAERFVNFPELIRELRSTIFVPPTTKEEIEPKSLECLATNHDGKERDRIAALIKWFYDQSDTLRKQADQDRRRADALQASLNQSNDSITVKELEIGNLKLEIDNLRTQLDVAHEHARVQGIHLRDDLRKQHGRTLRTLEQEVPMLQDTLKALERDPPKVTIAKDYLAWVIDNLTNELKHLRGN